MGNWFGNIQQIGKALMLPVAVLPAAALLLRFGAPDILDIPFVMKAGGAIFDNLALIFAIGIAVGLASDNNGAAGLAGAVGYLVLVNGLKAINPELEMGVLAGIVGGLAAGTIYNCFHQIKLPDFFGFFGGKRFVPIATAVACVLLAGIFGAIWPPVQNGLYSISAWILGAGGAGAFVYGFLNRLLILVGGQHILNIFAWFILGNYTDSTGRVVSGDLSRFFAGDPAAGNFMAGFYIIFMFAVPAIALAVYTTAKPENRKKTAGLLLPMVLTSFLTGITEPIEFMFMFLAPGLYFFHAVLTGAAMAVCHYFAILHGFGFSAGLIDYLLNWNLAKNPGLIIPVGLVFMVIYYAVFTAAIRRFDLQTPGRRTGEADGDSSLTLSERDLPVKMLEFIGGKENIDTLDCCVTRLRLTLKDPGLIDEEQLRVLGVRSILKHGRNVQIIIGTQAEFVAAEIKKLIR